MSSRRPPPRIRGLRRESAGRIWGKIEGRSGDEGETNITVYATALAAAKADYQHAVSVVAHEFYTQRNGVSIDAQELRALSNVIETAVAHPARFARRLRKLQRYARAIAALEPPKDEIPF